MRNKFPVGCFLLFSSVANAQTINGSDIIDGTTSLTKLQTQAARTIVGNATGSSAALTAVTPAQAHTLLSLVKDVKIDYGAVGDGVANDYSAFLAASASSARVRIPPGTYNLVAGNVFGQFDFDAGVVFNGTGRALNTTVGFFTDVSPFAVNIWRLKDRVLVGEAADVTPTQGLFSGLPGDLQNSASYLIRDATLGAVAINGRTAIGAMTQSSDAVSGASTIGIGSEAINNRDGASVRAIYGEIQHEPGAAASYVHEIVVKDKGDINSVPTPYGGAFSSGGIAATCGGDPSYGGQATTNCSSFASIGRTGTVQWNKGLVFAANALAGANGTAGGGNSATAIEMGYGQAIRWFSGNGTVAGGRISSITTASADQSHDMQFANNKVQFKNNSGSMTFDLAHVTNGANFLRVADAESGSPPSLSAQTTGSDVNIDINVTPLGAGTVRAGGSLTTPSPIVSGNIAAPSWTTNGIGLKSLSATYTDTTSTGTVASVYVHNLAAPTLAASLATTYSNAYTLDIAGCPVAGANVTLGTCGALRVGGGQSFFAGAVSGIGGLAISGATNLNVSNNAATNIGTGSTNQDVTLGGGSNKIVVGSPLNVTRGVTGGVRVISAAGSVSVTATDLHVCINKTTGAATTVNLESTPAVGHLLTVDDCKGDAATNNVTVVPAAGNIDGSSSFVIANNYGSWTGYYTGTIWKTIASK